MGLNKPSAFLRITILLCAFIQLVLGVLFVFAPRLLPSLVGLESAPAWTDWIFAMFGARAFGFAYGMIVSLRDLAKHRSWLIAMIVVQMVDWGGTIAALLGHKVTLFQVSTAAFLPILFVIVFVDELRKQRPATAK